MSERGRQVRALHKGCSNPSWSCVRNKFTGFSRYRERISGLGPVSVKVRNIPKLGGTADPKEFALSRHSSRPGAFFFAIQALGLDRRNRR